ncbi:TetR/AcrR family transcriptional regulator [Metabacillus indicus]|uniref:TetR/AcrR family transcriptional regulator n=1 Tax=Metabacillus indicus TaxID=246786 RepID=UPI00068C0D9C|nr:TetR/AcrR family transcriptional regulator [Metabacillus indicus]
MKQFERRVRSEKALLHAAAELVNEAGCSKTTLAMIMKKTGLSKGAIYHYIKSKDDLLAMVLDEKIQEINEAFFEKMGKSKEEMKDPAEVISMSFAAMNDPEGVVNRILVYFIGRYDHKTARNALRDFDHYMVEFAKFWILSGQKNGVISDEVDALKTAEFLVLMASGFRMRRLYSKSHTGNEEMADYIKDLLIKPVFSEKI